MRLLHVTDTHLGVDRWFRGAPPAWRRADDHLAALRLALQPALRGDVDAVLHSGDVFDRSRPPARAVADAHALFAEVARRVPVVVLAGNHDRRGLRAHFGGLPAAVTVLDAPAAVTLAGVRLGVVPYLPDARAWGVAAQAVCAEGVDLLCVHQAFDGARVPGFTFRVGVQADTVGAAHLPRGVRHVLCGHIHPRQVLRLGDATVVHPGATERTSFVERADVKGAVIWNLSATPAWHWVDLPARPMFVVRSPEDLRAVLPGSLVRLEGAARTQDIEREAIALGGWVEAWAAPTSQLALFPPPR